MNKQQVMDAIIQDYGTYTKKELEKWEWIEVSKHPEMQDNVFFDGKYVFFAIDKVIWY